MWMMFGGEEALDSYGGSPSRVPESHIDLMQSAVDYWETPDNIFIHANLEPAVSLAEQHDAWLRWTHLTGEERWYDPPRRVICGHTPQKSGYPLVFPGWVCLDTDCQRGGWLTAIDVEADWVWQANENGGTREFALGGKEE
jgi:serine/threonine protein phosphatase 1